jgi:hypothetical protein
MGLLERGKEVRTRMIEKADQKTLLSEIYANVSPSAEIVTDNYAAYVPVRDYCKKHVRVSHSTGEYVKGQYHTNTIENFWSLFKRGYVGTYHYMSDKHLDKCLDEFEFRYNSKKIGEIERFDVFLQEIQGRLKYKTLTV